MKPRPASASASSGARAMRNQEEKLLGYEEENHRMKRELAEQRERVKQLTSKLAYAERRVKTAATGPRSGASGRAARLENAVILKQVQAEDDAAMLDQRLRESERQVARERERVQLFKERAKEYKSKLNDTLKNTRIGVYGGGGPGSSATRATRASADTAVDARMKHKVEELEKEVEFLRAQSGAAGRYGGGGGGGGSATKARRGGARRSLRQSDFERAVGGSFDTDAGSSVYQSVGGGEDGSGGLVASPYFNEGGDVLGVHLGDVELQPVTIDGVAYLVDYSTSYVYRSPHGRVGPRLVGMLEDGRLKQTSLADVFETRLDEYLRRNKVFLEQLFKDFDVNNDGRLDATELQALLQEVMPGLSVSHVRFLQSFLDINNDSLSLNDFKASISECAAVSHTLKRGGADDVPELYTLLEKLRDSIESQRGTVISAFRELDRDNSGYLENGELLALIGRLLPGLSPSQKRLMLGKIHQMDVKGDSRISFKEFVRTLGLLKVVRPSPAASVSRVVSQWVLHEHHVSGGTNVFWVDRQTSKVYTPLRKSPTASTAASLGPVLVGRFVEGEVRVLCDDKSYAILARSLRRIQQSPDTETPLEKKFARFCEAESIGGDRIAAGDVARFIAFAEKEVSVGAAAMVQAMCTTSGMGNGTSVVRSSSGSAIKEKEGSVGCARLLAAVKEAVALMTEKTAGGSGRNSRIDAVLKQIKAFIDRDRKSLFLVFQKLDHGSGSLPLDELVRAVAEVVTDITDHRALVGTLASLDIDGLGRVSYDEVYNACGARQVRLVRAGDAKPTFVPAPRPSPGPSARSSVENLEVMRLRDENTALHAKLRRQEEEILRSRREASEQNALQSFADVDRMVLACEREDLPDLKEAWERVGSLQKRYQEAHVALSVLKANHARALTQLEETHTRLNDALRKNRTHEATIVELQMQLEAALELRPLLDAAQQEQLRLRKENEQLAASVIDAPADAMSKVNQLNVALAREQRERAAAELREAEARRAASETACAAAGGDSVSVMRKERDAARAESQRLQLDLEQLTEKLKVYSSGVSSDAVPSKGIDVASLDGKDDFSDVDDGEKSVKTLIAELHFSRDQYAVLHSELLKTTKLLRIEEAQSADLRADVHDMEEAFGEKEHALNRKIASLERELDRRSEKLRKAEAQLRRMFNRGDYNEMFGTNNLVVRSMSRPPSPGGVRDSHSASLLDELREGENVLEFHVQGVSLSEHAFGADLEPSTFLTWDFFEHQTQATGVLTGLNPSYNYTVQYVVKMDAFFIEYLDTRTVRVELNIANGLDFKTVGAAVIALKGVLEDYSTGQAFKGGAFHYADIVGAGNHVLGKLRYRSVIKFPFSSVLKEYYELKESASKKKSTALKRYDLPESMTGVAVTDPAMHALATSNVNSFIRITIKGCDGLVRKNPKSGAEMVPYVSYQVPSHPEHDTILGHGSDVALNDVAEFPMARTTPLMERLRTYFMDICVFDDADSDLSEAGVVGIGKVSLENLADGLPVDGKVFIYALNDAERCTGSVSIEIRWVNMFDEKPTDVSDGPSHAATRALGASTDDDVLQPRHLQPGERPAVAAGGLIPRQRGNAELEVLSASHGDELRPSGGPMSIRDSLRRSRDAMSKVTLGSPVPGTRTRARYDTNSLQDSVDYDQSTSSRPSRAVIESPDTAIVLHIKSVTLLGNTLLDDARVKNLLVLFELFLGDSGHDQWTPARAKARTVAFDYMNAFDVSPHTEVGAGNRKTILSMVKADAVTQSVSTVPFVLVSEGDPRGEDGYYEVATSSALDMFTVLTSGKQTYETTLDMEDEKGEKVAMLLIDVKIGSALMDLMAM